MDQTEDGKQTTGGMKPVMFKNPEPEVKGIPVGECTTNRKTNYADQKDPSEVARRVIQGAKA